MDQLEELKNKADIVQIISEYIPVKKAGRNYKALCPFHQEKTPSFIISPQLQIFKCFGCGVGGDVIKFVQLYERLEFWEAVETLAQKVGVKIQKTAPSRNELIKRKIYAINQQAAEFYHFLLNRHPIGKPALAYLSERGITQLSIKTFQLGFAPPHSQVIVKYLIEKKHYQPADLAASGLAIASTYRSGQLIDRFRSRIIFPIWDHRGNIIGFSGRTIPSLTRNSPEIAKYINTPETPVYHKGKSLFGLWQTKEEIKKKNQAIVVEGDFDLISCWQIGIKNAVALKGTAFTQEQALLIKRFADKLILALDEDAAGNEAVLKGVQLVEKEGLQVKVASLGSKFKDPDEAAQKDPNFLKKQIKRAENIWDFVIKLAIKRHGKKGPEALREVTRDTLPYLGQIENAVVRSYYLKKLSERLKIDEEAIAIEAERFRQYSSAASKIRATTTPQSPIQKDRREVLEQYLLELIFASPQPQKFLKPTIQKLFKTFRWQKVFTLAYQFSQKQKFEPQKFLAFLPEELKESFEKVFLSQDNQEEEFSKEIEKTIKQLKIIKAKDQLNRLSDQIAKEEGRKNQKKLKILEKKFSQLSQKLVELKSRG
jgi:DNA primase